MNCKVCNTTFKYYKSGRKNPKYCSYKCRGLGETTNKSWFKKGHVSWNKGKKLPRGEQSPNWKGGQITLTCKVCDTKFKRDKSKSDRLYCSRKCYHVSKKGKTAWNKGIPNLKNRGKNHPNWKGGKHESPSDRDRKTIEWKQWREFVFKRDKYVCQLCLKKSGMLHPHHLLQRKDYPELKYDKYNGITLCAKCHNNYHKILRQNWRFTGKLKDSKTQI